MRVLHIITSLRIGGAEHLLVELLPRLRQRGIDVELLLFDGTRTSFYEQLKHRGIQIYSLGKGIQAMHNPLLIFKLRKFLKKRYDVIHTHNTPCQVADSHSRLEVPIAAGDNGTQYFQSSACVVMVPPYRPVDV